MQFRQPLVAGRLVRRLKRFLADVELDDGRVARVLCPNPGSMKTCQGPDWPVLLSQCDKPSRKYRFSWELAHNGRGWISVNTHTANIVVREAITANRIPGLEGYPELRPEVKYGRSSRIDFLLDRPAERCYVEVKSVTLVGDDGFYRFPDSVTARGLKHLEELGAMVEEGHRAVMLFLAQRGDGSSFRPAAEIDPAYAEGLRAAYERGVEILAYRCLVTPEGVALADKVDFALEG